MVALGCAPGAYRLDLAGGEAFQKVGELGHRRFDEAPGFRLFRPPCRAGQQPAEKRGKPKRYRAQAPQLGDRVPEGGRDGVAHEANIAPPSFIVNHKNNKS